VGSQVPRAERSGALMNLCTHPNAETELLCDVCSLESPWECFPSCLKCSAAVIVLEPRAWNSNRKFYVGAEWLPMLDREIARQSEALAFCARSVA
jgi:hypothetical protein